MLDDLPTLDFDGIPSFYDEPPEARRDVEIGLEEDRVLQRTPTGRRTWNALHVANLARALATLPAAGETWHIVCKGNWPAWALVPRILDLAAPRRIRYLGIATLGFSRDNVDELAHLLDTGAVGTADLIYSCYFRSNEQELTGHLEAEMRRRGQRLAAIRTHAKILAVELDDGTGISVESSANLRSCRNVEQFTITNDAALLAFHRDWLNTLLSRGPEK